MASSTSSSKFEIDENETNLELIALVASKFLVDSSREDTKNILKDKQIENYETELLELSMKTLEEKLKLLEKEIRREE